MVEFMVPGVNRLAWEHDQIIRVVVHLVLVFVMDHLAGPQLSPQDTLSDHTVLVSPGYFHVPGALALTGLGLPDLGAFGLREPSRLIDALSRSVAVRHFGVLTVCRTRFAGLIIAIRDELGTTTATVFRGYPTFRGAVSLVVVARLE